MANEQAKQILQQGIAAARAGQQAQARQLLQEAIRRDPQSEAAWLWLSSVAKDNQERIFCLKQLLSINPSNENAIKGLKQLGVSVESATQAPASTVPAVDERKLTASMQQLDPFLQRYQPIPTRQLPFEWMKKKRGRVGDSSAALLRAAVIVGVLVVLGAIIGGGLFLVPKLGIGVSIFSTPTDVPTRAPTVTATVGLTETPSPVPRSSATPSYTPPPGVEVGSGPAHGATPVYPNEAGSAVREAQILMVAGRYDEAITRLERERQALINVKGKDYDAVIYHMVRSYLAQDNADRALALLNEYKSDTPTYQAAQSFVHFAQKDYTTALREATAAFSKDEQLMDAALLAAQIYSMQGLSDDASRVLTKGLERQPNNVALRTALGNIQLAANRTKEAYDNAVLALLIDPTDEDALILHVKALLGLASKITDRQERIQTYGRAVRAAHDLLYSYPGETVAWMLLGQARQGEENIGQAIDAYAQAVVADTKSPAARQVFLTRGKLYLEQRRYQEAFDDFDKANLIGGTTEGHQGRLAAALAMKNYGAAVEDANALLRENPSDNGLLMTKLDLLIRSKKYDDAAAILSDAFVNGLSGDNKAAAQLYRSIVRFQTQDYQKALEDANAALTVRDSGLGHYYRGQIYEALRRFPEALSDYQWVIFWDRVYKYDFMEDVNNRTERLIVSIPTITPTPTITVRPTITPSSTRTPRPTATDTPEPSETPTKIPTRTPRPTRGPSPTPSDTPEPSETPTKTPTPTPSETPTETPTASGTGSATESATPTPTGT
jgi:tetratricopeptide (TPR) repeat protein